MRNNGFLATVSVAVMLIFVTSSCSDDNPADANVPPSNQNAVHDTVALQSPPETYATLAAEWVGKIPGTSKGLRLTPDGVYVYQDFRPGDVRQAGDRIWFTASDVPFDPYTMTFNGTIVGDTLRGWYESYNRRDDNSVMVELQLVKRY